MIRKREKKDNKGNIIGEETISFIEISKDYKVKSIKTKENIIKSQVPAINKIYNSNNENFREVMKLYNLSLMYLNYASERQDYEEIRNKPNGSINITIEQVGSYLCCLSIELLLKAILYKQKGNLKIGNKVVHSIKKNWENINIEVMEKYDNFINEVDEIYGENGDKLRYNQSIKGDDFNNYDFNYEILLSNTKSFFNDCETIIMGRNNKNEY